MKKCPDCAELVVLNEPSCYHLRVLDPLRATDLMSQDIEDTWSQLNIRYDPEGQNYPRADG